MSGDDEKKPNLAVTFEGVVLSKKDAIGRAAPFVRAIHKNNPKGRDLNIDTGRN